MALPEERESDLERKMESPLFRQHFESESWQLLYFDAFRNAFSKQKEKTDLESLFRERRATKPRLLHREPGSDQSRPFVMLDDAAEEVMLEQND